MDDSEFEREFERRMNMTFSFARRTTERLMSFPKGQRSEILETLFNAWFESRNGEVSKEIIQRQIKKLQAQLTPLLIEYRELEEREELARELNVRKKIEEDCHATYLHELMVSGKIKVYRKVPLTREQVIDILKGVMDRLKIRNLVDLENLEIATTDKFQLRSIERALFRFNLGLDENRIVELKRETETITPESVLKGYGLRLDYARFSDSLMSGRIDLKSSLEDLKQFHPRIISSSIISEVKKSMLDDFARKGISVDEAKTRIEKPYRGGD